MSIMWMNNSIFLYNNDNINSLTDINSQYYVTKFIYNPFIIKMGFKLNII